MPISCQDSLWDLAQLSRCVNALEEQEEIGSILLEMVILLQYWLYCLLQGSSLRCFRTTLLEQIYTMEWNQVDARMQTAWKAQLQRQLAIGKRWLIVTKQLLFRAVILGGKRLASHMLVLWKKIPL